MTVASPRNQIYRTFERRRNLWTWHRQQFDDVSGQGNVVLRLMVITLISVRGVRRISAASGAGVRIADKEKL